MAGRPARLSDDDVIAIRELYACGERLQTVADQYGVTPQMISMIGRGVARTKVPGEADPERRWRGGAA